MDNKLEVIVKASGLEGTKAQIILSKFQGYFEIAAEWEAKAATIQVADASQKADIAMARVGRLFLRDKINDVEKERKKLKEQSLREGQCIDGIAKTLKGLLIPIRTHLDEQEHFVELKAAREAADKQRAIDKVLEAERLEKEKEEREEQERIRMENMQLRREAVEKEKLVEQERKDAQREIQKAEDAAAKAIADAMESMDVVTEVAMEGQLELEVTCPDCGRVFIPCKEKPIMKLRGGKV